MKVVVDTMVVRKANASLTKSPKEKRLFLKRIELLKDVAAGTLIPLYSDLLLAEYRRQITEPRNEFVRLYLSLLASTGKHNWHRPWTGDRGRARKCRFPKEDDHVLRTATLKNERSHLFTEEKRQLSVAQCVLREFNVKIVDPTS